MRGAGRGGADGKRRSMAEPALRSFGDPFLYPAGHGPFDARILAGVGRRLLGADGVIGGFLLGVAPGAGKNGGTVAVSAHGMSLHSR